MKLYIHEINATGGNCKFDDNELNVAGIHWGVWNKPEPSDMAYGYPFHFKDRETAEKFLEHLAKRDPEQVERGYATYASQMPTLITLDMFE